MPALAEEVEVDLSERGPEPVRVDDVDLEGLVADVHGIGRARGAGDGDLEDAAEEVAALAALAVDLHRHGLRLRPTEPDHHPVGAVAEAEDGVRVVVEALHQALQIGVDVHGSNLRIAPSGMPTQVGR